MKLSKEAKLFISLPELFLCMIRKHLHHGSDIWPKSCDAFPKGIPREIWDVPARHVTPYPGDNGIMFEEAPEEVEKDEGEKDAKNILHQKD
jgi:hypothetical protein